MADDSKTYTVGFCFSKDRTHVALICKERPKWQAGCLNGIGGHVDHMLDVTPSHTQAREFYEETGVMTNPNEWESFATLWGNVSGPSTDYVVGCYRAFTDDVYLCKTKTDETVRVLPVAELNQHRVIENLRYLIPLALTAEILNNHPDFMYARKPSKA